jgi:hypothetical protein
MPGVSSFQPSKKNGVVYQDSRTKSNNGTSLFQIFALVEKQVAQTALSKRRMALNVTAYSVKFCGVFCFGLHFNALDYAALLPR